MKNLIIYAFYGGMFVLAARFFIQTVLLAASWAAALIRRFFPDKGDPERMMASHMSVPITFVLTPADGETPEVFAARARSALESRYPEFEVILAVSGADRAFVSGLADVLGLKKVWMVCRKVLEAPPVSSISRVHRDQRLISLEIDSTSRGGLLGAAVNFATYPLICVAGGNVAPDALASLIVPFAADPDGCACSVGPLMPGPEDRRSGFFWLYNAVKVCGAAVSLKTQLWAGLPDVSVLLRKDSIVEAGGFGAVGRFEGVLMRIIKGARAREMSFVIKVTGGSAAHRGGSWLSKEWALGRNASGRLGGAGAALSLVPPALEFGAWLSAASAAAFGIVPFGSILVFLALACGGGLAFSLMAVFMQEAGFGLHLGRRQLLRTLAACLLESTGPRQVVCAVRTASRFLGACRRPDPTRRSI